MNKQKQPMQPSKGKHPKPVQEWRRNNYVLKIADKHGTQEQRISGNAQGTIGKENDDKTQAIPTGA